MKAEIKSAFEKMMERDENSIKTANDERTKRQSTLSEIGFKKEEKNED